MLIKKHKQYDSMDRLRKSGFSRDVRDVNYLEFYQLIQVSNAFANGKQLSPLGQNQTYDTKRPISYQESRNNMTPDNMVAKNISEYNVIGKQHSK